MDILKKDKSDIASGISTKAIAESKAPPPKAVIK